MPSADQQPPRPIARSGALPQWPDTALWVAGLVFTLLSFLVMLALLRQRDASNPWSRLDVYIGSFMVVAGVASVAQVTSFLRSAVHSTSGIGEAFGLTYDPGVLLYAAILEPGKLAVVLDYARWHLVPALEQPGLRALGVALAVAGAAGLVWTDRWLARHFAGEGTAAGLMTGGPYRFARHPRYASILLLALSMPLVFASILGWPLWFLTLLAVRHRIEREEPHLRELFGAAYGAYAARTARLLPGLY